MNVKYLFSSRWKNKNNRYYYGNDLPDIDLNALLIELPKQSGKFAVALEDDRFVAMIVDSISSCPLFWSIKAENIYISDDATSIANVTGSELAEENILEFLKTSYVTETETLYNGIYCLNPGNCVKINKTDGTVQCQQWFTLRYDHIESYAATREQLFQEFDKYLENVFFDLIIRLNGRTALIPLSGGCDSRIVATIFKRLKYPNVICFSYGQIGNSEAERSREIANNLGFEWIFVEYNADVWNSIYRTELYEKFLEFSCRGRSIGCAQALPAILHIKNKKLVPDDAVVIPGHTLDVIMGSHLVHNQTEWQKQELVEYILNRHYGLRGCQKEYGNINKWVGMISNTISGISIIDMYMQWEWRNRQARFVANDVRTYEFAGFDYELPFWDLRILEFASHLDLPNLYGRHFQYDYCQKVIDPECGIKVTYDFTSKKRCALKRLLNQFASFRFFIELRKRKRLLLEQNSDGNGFYSWLSKEEYHHYIRRFGTSLSINSIISEDYIKLLRTGHIRH